MFTTHSFLKSVGRPSAGRDHYDALADGMKRLRWTRLHVEWTDAKNKARERISGLLHEAEPDRVTGRWRIRLDSEIADMLAPDECTWIHSSTRRALGKCYLAKWLHGYFSSHRKPYPISVLRLHQLSGSSTGALKKFRQNLKTAMEQIAMVETGEGRRFAWHIDQADLVHVSRYLGGD